MKPYIRSLALLFLTLLCSFTQAATPKQTSPAYLIEDGKGVHIKKWLYDNVRIPSNFPVDSLKTSVTVCVNVSKEGELTYIPVGDNDPQLLTAVEKALNKKVHCVTHKVWNAETKSYDSKDYSTYVQLYFPYIKPEVMPEYTKKEFPKKWNRKNMYTVYRGTLLHSSFQQGESLKVSINNFRKWLSTRIEYPQEAIEKGLEGDFAMSFYIDKDFKIQIVDVIESPSPLFTAEVVKVVQNCPIWQPTLRWNFLTRKYDYVRAQFVLNLKFENPFKK